MTKTAAQLDAEIATALARTAEAKLAAIARTRRPTPEEAAEANAAYAAAGYAVGVAAKARATRSPLAYAHHSNLPDLRPASERGTVAEPADKPSALSPGMRAALAKAKKRPPRIAATPKNTGDTKIEIPSSTGTGYGYTFLLRPAKIKHDYTRGSGSERIAYPTKRADDAWFVLSKNGTYLGVLEEGSGREPWGVSQLESSAGHVGERGVSVKASIRSAVTWQEAVAKGWWVL